MESAANVSLLGEARASLSERCLVAFPCLSDPARRASLCLKVSLLITHIVAVGTLFIFDPALVQKFRDETWYVGAYLALLIVTLALYIYTSGSSPGFVVDAMRTISNSDTSFKISKSKQSASKEHGNFPPTTGCDQVCVGAVVDSANWTKMVMDLYPPGYLRRNATCSYCSIVQPPRTKHCHDCDKCVLHFDHHCIWLGTCIGQRNHCRFWWYLFVQTLLCTWTCVLYFSCLGRKIEKSWWMESVAIIFLAFLLICLIFLFLLIFFHSYLILTNQTTYELVKRRRILYLRGVPEGVRPFSKGICRNLWDFCCSWDTKYVFEAVPRRDELEAIAEPSTCTDVVSCRCCC